MKKIISIFLLIFSLSSIALAQGSYISAEPYPDGNYIEDLSEDFGILVLSKNHDLVFTIPNVLKFEQKYLGINKEGLSQYLIIIDGNDTRTPKIEVSQRGDVYKAVFMPRLTKTNFVIAYKVLEVENPIRIDDQTTPGDVRMNADEAEVLIETSLKDLKVELNPSINAKISRSIKTSDNSINVISIVIPIAVLQNARDKVASLTQELSSLQTKLLDDDSYIGTQAELDHMDKVEKDLKDADNVLSKLQMIYISSAGTNREAVDISDLGPRSKKCLIVVPLRVEVPTTECSERMRDAAERFKSMKYKEALSLYEAALTSEGCTKELKKIINDQYIKECNTCIFYDLKLKQSIKRAQDLVKQGSSTQREAIDSFNEAYNYAKDLYNYTSNENYLPMLNRFEEIMKSIPINISLTCVEWVKTTGAFYEGNPIPNVQVYADYGYAKDKELPKKGKKFLKNESSKRRYHLLGETDSYGNLILKIPRENQPTALIICPLSNDYNVEYKNIETVLSQSKGSYLERQFRMKLKK